MNKATQAILKRYEADQLHRQPFETLWQDCVDYIVPHRQSFTRVDTPGTNRNRYIYDSTATNANEKFANAVLGNTSDPTGRWFSMEAIKWEANQNEDFRAWLDIVENAIYHVLKFSSYYAAKHELNIEMGAFGTGVMLVEETQDDNIINFRTIPLAQICLGEDAQGKVNRVCRKFCLEPAQVLQEFPTIDADYKQELIKLAGNQFDTKIEIINAVYAKESGYPGENSLKPFVSVYFDKAKGNILGLDGYFESPYIVTRWNRLPGEVYGRGPGLTALADIKMLNAMAKTIIEAGQKAVNPPLIAPSDSFIGKIKVSPGAINFVRRGYRDTQNTISPMQFGGNFQLGLQQTQQIQRQIQEVYMIDLIMDDKRAEMTATEAQQREAARMKIMAPQLGRLHHEFFSPLLSRIYAILRRREVIPPPPEGFEGEEFAPRYVSPLAKAQKLGEMANIQNGLQQLSLIAPIDPTVMQKIDTAGMAEYILETYGFPQKTLKSKKQLEAEQRKQAEAQQQAQEQAQSEQLLTDSQSVKNISDVIQTAREGAA